MLFYSYSKYPLQFSFDAKTSRGSLQTHQAYFIQIKDSEQPGIVAWGEASPLKGLSIDDSPDFENKVQAILLKLNTGIHNLEEELSKLPALNFALETAYLDLKNGGKRLIFDSSFLQGNPISINGLVWMADIEKMKQEAADKIEKGFDCIKFKIGAHDFDQECMMIESIRKNYSSNKLSIRLDANGAFNPEDAVEKLKELSRFEIHSVEQPIKAKQLEQMQEVCAKSKIKIALDEELIGVNVLKEGTQLLKKVKPHFIILKPTLLGGFKNAEEWIKNAQLLEIGWWVTSALESNIGLNAIAQWCAQLQTYIPQGLGTGGLYTNNIPSPLVVKNGKLIYIAKNKWVLPNII